LFSSFDDIQNHFKENHGQAIPTPKADGVDLEPEFPFTELLVCPFCRASLHNSVFKPSTFLASDAIRDAEKMAIHISNHVHNIAFRLLNVNPAGPGDGTALDADTSDPPKSIECPSEGSSRSTDSRKSWQVDLDDVDLTFSDTPPSDNNSDGEITDSKIWKELKIKQEPSREYPVPHWDDFKNLVKTTDPQEAVSYQEWRQFIENLSTAKPGDTIGVITTTDLEFYAAVAMLDEEFQGSRETTDEITYAAGRIRWHTVVVASRPTLDIPRIWMRRWTMDKPSEIKVFLWIGVGSGVPSHDSDVRLGDVVVSDTILGPGPRSTRFHCPPLLQCALERVKANHARRRREFLYHLSALAEADEAFSRENAGLDYLFRADYQHEVDAKCEGCDKSKLLKRKARPERSAVHYGKGAIPGVIVRNGTTRDRICQELGGGVLCFSMPLDKLGDKRPHLAILGICDYADSHNGSSWGPFAAAGAAAYMRELVSAIPHTKDGVGPPSHYTTTGGFEPEEGGRPNNPKSGLVVHRIGFTRLPGIQNAEDRRCRVKYVIDSGQCVIPIYLQYLWLTEAVSSLCTA